MDGTAIVAVVPQPRQGEKPRRSSQRDPQSGCVVAGTFMEGPVTYTVAGDAETSTGAGTVYVFRGSLTPDRLVLRLAGAGTDYPSGVYTDGYVGRSSRWRQEFARRAVGVYREHVGAIRECGQ